MFVSGSGIEINARNVTSELLLKRVGYLFNVYSISFDDVEIHSKQIKIVLYAN